MQQASPNIVLILMDNLGYGEVACYGGWPDQIPADRESNEIVHEVDTFTTLARFAGAVVPQDRPIDGVDLGDFFRGATDRSAREGFVIFFGEKIYGAKWRNFKMLLVEQVRAEMRFFHWASRGSTTCTPTRRRIPDTAWLPRICG